MAALYCGHPMKSNPRRLCRWRIFRGRPCTPHGTAVDAAVTMDDIERREAGMRLPPGDLTGRPIASKVPEPRRLPAGMPEPVAARDLPGLCWWLIEQATTADSWDVRWAGVVVTTVRALAALPPGSLTPQEARDEAFLRGKIVNGIPPETADEWALAEAIFTDEALEELRSWNQLWKRDDDHVDEPLVFPERARIEAELPALFEDED
jgi:hypothetical protein